MKPHNLLAFTGDSILVQVAVFTDNEQPYDLDANKIDQIILVIPKLGFQIGGSRTGKSLLEIFIPASAIEVAGVYTYYIIIANDGSAIRYTIAYGKLTVKNVRE